MHNTERRRLAFVRALLTGGRAYKTEADRYEIVRAGRRFSLPVADCKTLVADGVLTEGEGGLICRPEAKSWIKRQLAGAGEAFAAQHQSRVQDGEGRLVSLEESPLARLGAAGSSPYFDPHQIEAGERFRRLFARAGLRSRVTMTYNAARTARRKGTGTASGDISDMAVDARRELGRIHTRLPPECAGILFDVCGFEKGLQTVERERGWPRRSAKLILRIGLEQLAQYFGLSPVATGTHKGRHEVWLDEGARPTVFG